MMHFAMTLAAAAPEVNAAAGVWPSLYPYFFNFLASFLAIGLAGYLLARNNRIWLRAEQKYKVVDNFCNDLQKLITAYFTKGGTPEDEHTINAHVDAFIIFIDDEYPKVQSDIRQQVLILLNITERKKTRKNWRGDLTDALKAIIKIRFLLTK